MRERKYYWIVQSGVIAFFLLPFCETNFLLAENIFLAPSEKSVIAKKTHPKLENTLVQLVELHAEKGSKEANNFARRKGIDLKEDRVKVIIVTKKDHFLSQSQLSGWGAAIEGRYQNLVEARVPLTSLIELPDQLPEIFFIRLPYRPLALDTSEGVGLIGASEYHSEGITGLNTKVAIIDLGFDNLTETIANGDLPSSVITQDYTGTGLEADTKHGTGVAEIVYDLAANAELHLLKIGNEVHLGLAKDYCLSNNINIINHSVGWVNTNFYDGTGIICGIANNARSGGILWVNAAGNEAAGTHWEGTFIDTDGDDYHEFDPGVDESDAIYAYNGNTIAVFLTWNDWPASDQDYDLYLYRGSQPNPVASSTRFQTGTQEPTEDIYYEVQVEDVYHVVIQKYSATSDHELELYSFYHDFQYWNAESSLMAPADATGVVAAGAIDQADWDTGPQEIFSSQGPTNDGRTKPDLCGPDGTSGFTYGYLGFYGTSSGSPHVAGAAALLLSANPGLNADQLQTELEANAIDMGQAGKDNLYGSGRLNLPSLLGTAPVITSTPVTSATVGQLYTYDVNATGIPEPNYALITSPSGMDINSVSGEIEWTPDVNRIGDVNVIVEANNTAGFDRQSFSITVLPSDNFDDNRRSAMWRLFEDDHANTWLVEDANRLNVRATGKIYSPNCVGQWKMNDDAPNTVVIDSSGKGNHGTAQQNTSVLHTDGKINGALTFDGTTDYVDCGDIDIGTGSRTFAAWVRADSTSVASTIIGKDAGTATTEAGWIYQTNGTIRWRLRNSVSEGNRRFATTLTTGGWHFLVATYDTTDMHVYFDGALDDGPLSGAVPGSVPDNSVPLQIGAEGNGGFKFNGTIDNVMIFDRALTPEEIEALYNAGNGTEILPGESNPLVAFYVANGWSFDVNEDFALAVDFHYSPISDQAGWVGITVENDNSYVSISAGSDSNEPNLYYETVVDGNVVFEKKLRDSNDDTLYLSYDSNSNSVYLSHVGYGSENAYIWQTISNPLQVQWASPVNVSIGGGFDGVSLSPGEAYLDNLEIATATLLGWPPATDLDSDGFIGLGDVAVMSGNWLGTGPGDINNDGIVNFRDFAELGLAW